MRGVAELIDRRDRRQPISAVFKDFGVPRKRRVIAGDRHNARDRALRQLTRLLLGALPRWIEYNGVQACEFLSDEGLPEEIAPDRVDWLEAARRRARLAQRADRGLIRIDRDYSRSFGKPQREWANAGKEIRNISR